MANPLSADKITTGGGGGAESLAQCLHYLTKQDTSGKNKLRDFMLSEQRLYRAEDKDEK